ncbi:MAG: AI-2E family transporter [Intrasporangium sp.]|uniref:AI-2E family transporter n=1 Tax=Intrasporangium sp. TaxID=1925024 RepID=UPI002649E607|nr:AI-2E family transporter [Intrasporangium sp.]MDN5797479.1 AI-2E family transporter [Intrasporangium sp.]
MSDKDRYEPPASTVLTHLPVPASLAIAAAWCWRILVVSVTGLALVMLIERLYLVFLPVFFALLLAALLHPLVALLRRLGFPRALATWGTVIVAMLVLGGVGWFVVQQAAANYQQLVGQVNDLVSELRGYLDRLPFTNSDQLQQLQDSAVDTLRQHTGEIANGIVTVGTLAAEVVTGLVVMLFLTYFFLDEGDRMWSWSVRLFPRAVQPSVRGAGYRAWHSLSGWIVGTALIAAFHGIVIGFALFLLGVPLAAPLAVLVFIGSFIPIVGAVAFGGLAVLVTLISQGLIPGVILLAVLVVENQVEAHLLQPFVVGRAVKLHPVAIILALTAGGLLGGVFGAILVIPIVASAHAAVKYLTGVEDLHGNPRPIDADRMAPEPPPEYAPLPIYVSPPAKSDDDRAAGAGAGEEPDLPESDSAGPDVTAPEGDSRDPDPPGADDKQ